MLEVILIEIVNDSIILSLIHNRAINNQPYDHILSRSLQKLALELYPIDNAPGAFRQFGKSLEELRRGLFGMLKTDDAQAKLAEECLIKIDELRDEYGHLNEEPRHPDINSGMPWPKEALNFN